jgi:hypothetical protein
MTEIEKLRALVRELADALDLMGDAIDDPAFEDLILRARKEAKGCRDDEK